MVKEPKKPTTKTTIKQKKLVAGIIAGKSKVQAGIDAWYSKRSAWPIVSEILKKPNVQALIEAEAEKALSVIKHLCYDTETPHNVRYTSAKDILDRAWFKPKEKIETTGKDGWPIQLEQSLEQTSLETLLQLARWK